MISFNINVPGNLFLISQDDHKFNKVLHSSHVCPTK